jgi:4-amino-4-deoxy-L-arabinose transferase-like glycosyltransferase
MKESAKTSLFLAVVLLIATTLRLYKLDSYGIFFDEKATLLISQGICMGGAANQLDIFEKQATFTPADFWKQKSLADYNQAIIRGDIGNSPFYYVIFHGWTRLVGLDDWSIRLLSVLFSVLFVWLVFYFVNVHFRQPGVALLAAFLVSIEPFFITFSHQARNYSLTYCLTLLATHVFLLLVNSTRQRWGLYVAYALLVAASLLSHYLSFTVFLGHGIYVLLYVRNFRKWLFLALAIGLGLVPMILWFGYGGGTYTLRTLAFQADFYRKIAESGNINYQGMIDLASFNNVFKKTWPILSDLFLSSNGWSQRLIGTKNWLLTLIFAAIWGFILQKKHPFFGAQNPTRLTFLVLLIMWGLGSWLFSVAPLGFAAVVVTFGLGLYLFQHRAQVWPQISHFWFLVWMSFLPLAVLVFFAFKNGHTFGITPRYQGFAFPYACMLLAFALYYFYKEHRYLGIFVGVILLGQLVHVAGELRAIYQDTYPKLTGIAKPRQVNPHWAVAQRIPQLYQAGDTLVYPSFTGGTYSEFERFKVSYLDAQLVNMYLPKQATYLQRVDPQEPNRLMLHRKSGERILLFDFEETKYRY